MKKRSRNQTQIPVLEMQDREGEPVFINSQEELPGSVYKVPDKMWGFDAVGRIEHPGACTSCTPHQRQAVLLQGTDAKLAGRGYPQVVVISPSAPNGLTKPTAFAVEPRIFRLRKVELLAKDRRIGTLEPAELNLLRNALERVWPAE